MARISSGLRRKGKSIGLVPTMGYLHEGHLSLIRKARKENDIVVVSIFVNPIQFGPKEDYRRYPRDIKRDNRLAKKEDTDIIYFPSVAGMYQSGYDTFVDVEDLGAVMCGASRPGHFKGVCTVCSKLFNIVRPDVAYFGQKDYQQAQIIKRMVEDLNVDLRIKVLPIVREKDGLAISSRNKYLLPEEKKDALTLYESLKEARRLIRDGRRDPSYIKRIMRSMISRRKTTRIDYITIADPKTLRPKVRIDNRVLVALAVKVGRTRLIDNILVSRR